jgi:hypothetical protein
MPQLKAERKGYVPACVLRGGQTGWGFFVQAQVRTTTQQQCNRCIKKYLMPVGNLPSLVEVYEYDGVYVDVSLVPHSSFSGSGSQSMYKFLKGRLHYTGGCERG